VAVVGGGPTGLSCAFELAKMGHAVTLFDGEGPGGIPRRSIPTFRLTEKTVSADVGFLIANFKTVRKNVRAKDLQSTKRKFDAVFLASGLGNDRPLSTKGEKLDGVIPVLQFLQGAKKGNGPRLTRKRVVVVGGGNVSLDAAAMAKRLGASTVTLIYRRGEKEMKVWKSELQEAIKQGVEFRFLTSPAEIVGKKKVSGIVCRRTKLSTKKDSSGRPIPVEVKGSEHVIAADLVIIAIGQEIAPGLFDTLERTPRGYIKVDKEFRTSEPGIFAGGDMVSGEGTIVQSVAHGKSAANAIHGYISSQR
jgi:NADPH-dependent glutamate synthase beta subunit-like oxidoreductase